MATILHIIPSLGQGGAEVALSRLLLATPGWRHEVTVLTALGLSEEPLASRLRSCGIPVRAVDSPRTLPSPLAAMRLVRAGRSARPDIIMGWMYHGCLTASCLAPLASRRPALIWTIRSGCSPHIRPGTRLVRTILRTASGRPDAIVYPSNRARAQHHAIGFSPLPGQVIPNGYDPLGVAPPPDARMRIRDQLGIDATTPVVAWIGRWHSDKAPQDALAAFALLHRRMPTTRLLMAGTGCGTEDAGPRCAALSAPVRGAVCFLGRRQDATSIMAAADVLCLSSHSESFPNVLAEAMLAGTPCVSTDAGDASDIVGPTGIIVPTRIPERLADGMHALLSEEPEPSALRRRMARERIIGRFSMSRTAGMYDGLWNDMMTRVSGG